MTEFKTLKAFLEKKELLLNATESPIENLLLHEMTRRSEFAFCPDNQVQPTGPGVFIHKQFQCGPYRADFLLTSIQYHPGAFKIWPPNMIKKIIVECDGREFHHVTQAQIDRDIERDKYFLEHHSLKTIRFTGQELNRHPRLCVDQILNELGWS